MFSLKHLLFLALFCGFGLPANAADDQNFITIGTAGVTGIYYPAGGATCRIVNLTRRDHGIRCSVETSLGSISNLTNIRSGELDFGYVQSDWQHHAYFGTSAFQDEGPFEDLRTVFSLHDEVATIVVREDSGVRTFDDLKGKRVNIGGSGSGSAATWNAVIGALGWREEDQANVTGLRTSELADNLCSGQIDAYFVLIGHPAGLVEETQEQCKIKIMGIEPDTIDAFLKDKVYYRAVTVPKDLYDLEEPVNSFGVVATFVTSRHMPDHIVETLVGAVVGNFEDFTRLHPALRNLSIDNLATREVSAPLHNGALNYFRKKGLLPDDSSAQ